ncbi:MAG TPA: hypothetical protein VEU30_00365, partial [Thermoanaerobaculia bacterium]|nr:hypothetical protein [Thermoanaerobaculia bacterium]
MTFRPRLLPAIVALALTLPLLASDHADPMILQKPDANITGLFFFPHGDRMILVFNVRRALRAPKPYDLSPYEYVIHLDTNTPVTFGDEDRLRYGGAVSNPSAIKENISLRFRLNDDTTLKSKAFTGLTNPDQIVVWSGVRDDPFIFPRFFEKNVISMVTSVPRSSFPAGKQDFIVWGSVYQDGKQIDHVGRSNRTQLGRFDFLNTLPPNEHVPAIMKAMKFWDGWYNRLHQYKETDPIAGLIQYVLQIRKYDLHPDVMIYSDRYPAKFPNGRQLPDDIVGLTCEYGDCILQELAYVEGKDFPRKLVNDKPFSDQFPFLAEPWPDEGPATPSKSVIPLLV